MAFAENLAEEVGTRCQAQMGGYGVATVKLCIEKDMEAFVALSKYPEQNKKIVDDCYALLRNHGYAIVKTCVDQDIQTASAVSK
jgi:formate-dependent phosphoribosylglycinamide formyltransferase (GAR transformylase)